MGIDGYSDCRKIVVKSDKSAAPFLPANRSIRTLRSAAATCKGCELWKYATQTVFGEGGLNQQVMLVGEQPGDQEDLSGHPFVGPAGRILNFALEQINIEREQIYVTNAVKHFKFEPRGKRRIHKKPSSAEVRACRPWLEAEIDVLKPQIIVCLGSTAAQAILGPGFRVTQARGQLLSSPLAPFVLATVHPSSLLRQPDEESRRAAIEQFVKDLSVIRKAIP